MKTKLYWVHIPVKHKFKKNVDRINSKIENDLEIIEVDLNSEIDVVTYYYALKFEPDKVVCLGQKEIINIKQYDYLHRDYIASDGNRSFVYSTISKEDALQKLKNIILTIKAIIILRIEND